jgi:hypothetical protein
MYCRKCGAKNIEQAKFCAKCGSSLVNNQPQAINDKGANEYSNKVIDSNLEVSSSKSIDSNKVIDSNELCDSNKVVGTKKDKKFTVVVTVLIILCVAAVGVITYKVLINKFENSKTTASNSNDSKDKEASSVEDALKSTVAPEGSVTKEIDNNSNSVSSNGDKQVTQEAKADNLDQKELSMIGTINSNLNLHMKLSFNKNEVTGTYYYDSYSTQSLKLKGIYDKDSNVVMNESDSNGSVTGVFNGVISPNGTFIGKWSSPDGTKKFPFVINTSN